LSRISDIIARPETFVWLDIAQPSEDDFGLLQREFAIHEMAIEDATLWHERPKIEFYDNFVLVIAHAVTVDEKGEPVIHEIAILAGPNYVITLRAYPIYPTDEIEKRRRTSITAPRDATGLVYIILDTIVIEPLKPGLGPYFRDVHDHVLRVLEQIDVTRELVNSTLDTHLAMQSHKQGEISKQLTVIATIFLPLTYITGFFGQNFAWMVNGLGSPEIFWCLGIGSQLVTLAVTFWYFKRRRWF
jgi:Mg2+ and Co2+ transporter CorA